jgi:4-amino-4-deoxy-L-arabinose transferase-like glycosyltransferase
MAEAPPPTAAPRPVVPLLLVVAAGLLLFFPGLGNHDLWNPNEPVFAEGAREMLERGDYLLAYVNDRVYLDKPILYFWAILAASLPWGAVTETAARLPSAVASLAILVVVLLYARRAFSLRAGWIAALALATMPVFIWEARFAQMDPMLTLFMLLCLVSFDRARAGRAAWWLAASGAWAGLAVLTKGPVGLVLPGAAALAVLLLERDLRFLARPAWLAGAAAFVLVGAPWYVALAVTGHQEWLVEFFFRQNVGRFVDPFDHARPFYYYGIRFVSDLFPWCLFLPLIALDRPRAGAAEPHRRAWNLMAVYTVVVLAFFSASGAKRGVYILPLYPAYALLVGRLWDRLLAGALSAGRRRAAGHLCLVAGLVLVALGATVFPAVRGRYPEFVTVAGAFGAVTVAGGLAVTVLALRRRAMGTLAALVGTLSAMYLVLALAVVPRLDAHKSARPFSDKILAHAGTQSPLRVFRFWKWRSSYLFYTQRLMPEVTSVAEMEEYLSRPEPVFVLIKEEDRKELEEKLSAPFHRLESEGGRKGVHLYSNRPAG